MIRLLIALGVLASTTTWAIGADFALGCFARVYDRAHLAKHPDQIVTGVKLHILRRQVRDPPYAYDFALRVRMRGRNEPLSTVGLCKTEPPGVKCIVECDGGEVRIVPRADHAMMYLDRIRMAEDLPNGGEELTGGKDDRVFHLDRVADRVCAGVKP